MNNFIFIRFPVIALSACLFTSCTSTQKQITTPPPVGTMEVVAQLSISPGNVAVAPNGRIFATVHQFRRANARLIEIFPPKYFRAWPNLEWNKPFGSGNDVLNSPLGLEIDDKNRLWVIDNGFGNPSQTPKLLAFNIASGELVYRYDFPPEVGPKGSFIQDLVVDSKRGFVYLADLGGDERPVAIITVDTKRKESRRYEQHFSLNPEDNLEMKVEEKSLTITDVAGQRVPVKVGIDPITLSADGENLYYGAMTGQTWYRLPASLLREGRPDEEIERFIYVVGEKPVSDGACTDRAGNHFFTNLENYSIDRLDILNELETVVKDDRLLWPDDCSVGPDGWLYTAVNQLHRAPFFNAGKDWGRPPYYIMKIWPGTAGISK